MRCPKCHYISFDSGERCRNCGYDFSLTIDVREPDLPIQTGDEPLGPMSDFDLKDLDRPRAPEKAAVPAAAPAPDVPPRRPIASSPLDLPLFTGRDDDAPLVTPQAIPRAPLAVRRAAAIPPRPRPHVTGPEAEPVLDLGTPEPAPAPAPIEPPFAEVAPAPMGRRLAAGAIDACILGAIDGAVLYFTLALCGLQLAEAAMIPIVPFGAFVALLNGGYLVAFTAAAGQTIGKMAAGIRVTPFSGDAAGRVSFGVAVVRAAVCFVSVLPAGLGFVPAVFSADHRALHDRLAGTRVVLA